MKINLPFSRREKLALSLSLGLLVGSGQAWGKPSLGRIPDEYESTGGHSLGFGNAGSAAVSGQGSVRTNPAMLALEKQYTLSAGYHWPTFGREYYQAGAIDSKTSPLAAGFTYTSSRVKFQPELRREQSDDERLASYFDSPIRYRASLAMAQAFSYFSLGLGVQYVEGFSPNSQDRQNDLALTKGATFGFGLAGLLTSQLRYGFSAENLGNARVKDLAPSLYRAGLAYTLFNGELTAHVDYIHRQRVPQELAPSIDPVNPIFSEQETGLPATSLFLAKPEQMVIASFSARIQDLIRLLGSYGQEVSKGQRRMVAGGIAVVNGNTSFSYLASQPYLAEPKTHHALSLSMQVSL